MQRMYRNVCSDAAGVGVPLTGKLEDKYDEAGIKPKSGCNENVFPPTESLL